MAEQGDWCINVISGVMSVLCGLRWGHAGWLWAVEGLAVGWLSGGQGRECVTWPEVGLMSSAYRDVKIGSQRCCLLVGPESRPGFEGFTH